MKSTEINLPGQNIYLSIYKKLLIIEKAEMGYNHSVGVTHTKIRKYL